jgi:hypothetical protein
MREKEEQYYATWRCKVGVTPLDSEVWWKMSMSRAAFRVFQAGRAADTRVAICAM